MRNIAMALLYIAKIFQLRVTCKRGQVISMSMDYYTPGGGEGGGCRVR